MKNASTMAIGDPTELGNRADAMQMLTREEGNLGSKGLMFSVGFFALLYMFSWTILLKQWRGQKRYRAASSCIAFVHGLVVSILATYDLVSTPWRLDAPNSVYQTRVMEYSMAYFLVDLAHYLYAVPNDYLFIAHHLMTLTYMLSCCYYVQHSAKSVMCLIVVGEITTPMQSIWTLARMQRGHSYLAHNIYRFLSPIFTIGFTITRGLLGPFLLKELAKFYLWGHADIVLPRWIAFSWMTKVAFAVIGSAIWGYKLWVGLLKFYAQRRSNATTNINMWSKYD